MLGVLRKNKTRLIELLEISHGKVEGNDDDVDDAYESVRVFTCVM